MSTFQFKEFTIIQEKSAMKVGTDSILLGSWVQINDEQSILDIGSGTGILALLLAQRSEATLIDAVEIEENAHEEAVTNFENSPWSDRLFCYHSSIQEFAKEIDETYDLIIANPPFFEPYKRDPISAKSTARQTHALDFYTLLEASKLLLNRNGSCAFIIPFDKEASFIELAQNTGLFVQRITRVKDKENATYKRSLLQFKLRQLTIDSQELILKNYDTRYTDVFIKLTADYYLEF